MQAVASSTKISYAFFKTVLAIDIIYFSPIERLSPDKEIEDYNPFFW